MCVYIRYDWSLTVNVHVHRVLFVSSNLVKRLPGTVECASKHILGYRHLQDVTSELAARVRVIDTGGPFENLFRKISLSSSQISRSKVYLYYSLVSVDF